MRHARKPPRKPGRIVRAGSEDPSAVSVPNCGFSKGCSPTRTPWARGAPPVSTCATEGLRRASRRPYRRVEPFDSSLRLQWKGLTRCSHCLTARGRPSAAGSSAGAVAYSKSKRASQPRTHAPLRAGRRVAGPTQSPGFAGAGRRRRSRLGSSRERTDETWRRQEEDSDESGRIRGGSLRTHGRSGVRRARRHAHRGRASGGCGRGPGDAAARPGGEGPEREAGPSPGT